MKNRTKIIFTLVIILAISFAITTNVSLAQEFFNPDEEAVGKALTEQNIFDRMTKATAGFGLPGGGDNPDATTNAIIGGIINAFLSIFGVIFMILIIYGGYKWMMARGNEEDITKAKGIVRGAIIGFIIVMVSYSITFFITSALQKATV